jgi:glycine cleavage system H protein
VKFKKGKIMPKFLETSVDKFTFRIASDRLYSEEGVWAKEEGTLIRIGLSDFVQQRSGDVAFAEVRPAGTKVSYEDEIAVIETIKVNISLGSPLGGKVLESNPAMETTPEAINLDPYGDGWLVVVDPDDWGSDKTRLLSAQVYFEKIKVEAKKEVGK